MLEKYKLIIGIYIVQSNICVAFKHCQKKILTLAIADFLYKKNGWSRFVLILSKNVSFYCSLR